MVQFFAHLQPEEFFWTCLIAGAVGAGSFVGMFVFLHRKRLMEDTPTARIRSAHQGYVELEGTGRVMDGPPIVAPLTHGKCLWWSYKIEEKRRHGKNTSWVTIDHGRSDEIFELEDVTGRCIVDPDGATVIPSVRDVWYGLASRPDRGPAMAGGWLRAAFCRYRYSEERLNRDGPLYAIGGFRTQAGGADAFDEQADVRELLNKWKHEKAMMALLDVNKDGQIDTKEWEAARRMAATKVRAEHVQRAVETTEAHILGKPRDSRPFILSGVPQATLIRRYSTKAIICLVLSTVGLGVVLVALTARGLV